MGWSSAYQSTLEIKNISVAESQAIKLCSLLEIDQKECSKSLDRDKLYAAIQNPIDPLASDILFDIKRNVSRSTSRIELIVLLQRIAKG